MATTSLIGDNIEATIEGNILVLRIDLAKDLGPSASGKSNIVATTRGNLPIVGTRVIAGINIYSKRR